MRIAQPVIASGMPAIMPYHTNWDTGHQEESAGCVLYAQNPVVSTVLRHVQDSSRKWMTYNILRFF
jgi:hypothetical protein